MATSDAGVSGAPAPPAGGYGRTQRRVESVALGAYAVCVAGLVADLAPQLADRPGVVLAAALAGYVLADLLSGVVHWLADTYGSAETPLVGRTIIYGFREHHDAPTRMLEHDVVETNGAVAAGALPVGLVALLLPASAAGPVFVKTLLATLTLAVVATNQFHKWAHARRVPWVVAWLQRTRLILHPAAHARHHMAPFRTGYCITTGWLNAPLARLGILAAIERAVARRLRTPAPGAAAARGPAAMARQRGAQGSE